MTDKTPTLDEIFGEYFGIAGVNLNHLNTSNFERTKQAIHQWALDKALEALPEESTYNKYEKCPYCGGAYQYACNCDEVYDRAIREIEENLKEKFNE